MSDAPLLVCAHCGRDIVSDEPYMANGHPYCDGFCYRDALDDDYREAVAQAGIDYGYHDHDPF